MKVAMCAGYPDEQHSHYEKHDDRNENPLRESGRATAETTGGHEELSIGASTTSLDPFVAHSSMTKGSETLPSVMPA